MMSNAVLLMAPARVDSITIGTAYCSPATAALKSQERTHSVPAAEMATVGCARFAGTCGTAVAGGVNPDSAALARRQLIGSPSGSNKGKAYVRNAPACN